MTKPNWIRESRQRSQVRHGSGILRRADAAAIAETTDDGLREGRVRGEQDLTVEVSHIAPIAAYNPALPPALEGVILKALEKDPARRFSDADGFIAALERAAQGVAPEPALVPGDLTEIIRPTVPIPAPILYPALGPSIEPEYIGPVFPEPLPPGPEAGPGRWWVALLVGLLVAGLIVAGLLLFNKAKVDVPNEVGVPRAEAELTLKRKGLSTDVTLNRHPTVAADIVIGQDPAGGSRISKGDVVTLVVSSGPGEAEVPDVINLRRSEAREALTKAGFKIKDQRQNDDTIKENRVIGTRPDAGEQRDVGSTVVLLVSSGRERVARSPVTDLSESDARATLESAVFSWSTARIGRTTPPSPAPCSSSCPPPMPGRRRAAR